MMNHTLKGQSLRQLWWHYINVLIPNFLDLYWDDQPNLNCSSKKGIAIKVGSSLLSPFFSCRAFLILTPFFCAWTTVGLLLLTTRHWANGMGMTLCSKRNFIPSMRFQSSIQTRTQSRFPIHSLNLIDNLFNTPTIGNPSKLRAWSFPFRILTYSSIK